EDIEDELAWILRLDAARTGFGLWATVAKDSGALIGRSGLLSWIIDERPEAELAWMLAKPWWGRGLATEVARALVNYGFDELGLRRLVAIITPQNHASANVA